MPGTRSSCRCVVLTGPGDRFDGAGFEAEALADQALYSNEMRKLGHEDNVPAAIGHNDPIKVDAGVADWHFPSDEERATLRRVPEKLPLAMFAIGVCELAERFSFYGATQVFTNYIANPRPSRSGAAYHKHNGKSGALGKGDQAANGLTTFNQFWCYCTPLIGAWIADEYLGRYTTISVAVGIAMVGHILLVISAIPSVLDNSQGSYACFIIAIVIMGLGTGFFKSNCSVLIAEQMKIKEQTVVILKNGEKVIIDPALTTARVYMWFYMLINLGSLGGQLGMIYAEKYVGFWLAYLLPTIVFLIPIPVLFFGRNYYVRTPPQGSVLGTAVRALMLALKRSWSWSPMQLLRNTRRGDFWNSIKPSMMPAESQPKWMQKSFYSDMWVDEVARGFKACQVFVLFPLYWLCYNQINNNLIIQANQMYLGSSPSEIVAQLDPIFIIVFVLLFQFCIYPLVDKYRIPLTPLKRIVIGFMIASFSMVWAAVLQSYIYKTNPCGSHVADEGFQAPDGTDCSEVTSNLSVWIQSGSYVLVAFSELFASVTSLEYAMLMAPKSMRSMIMGISLFTTAIAAAIGEAFNPLASNPLFTVNYAVFAGLSFLAGLLFMVVFRDLDRRQEEMNTLDQKPKNGEFMIEQQPELSEK